MRGDARPTWLERLVHMSRRHPYGDRCSFCALGHHGDCLGTRWRVVDRSAVAQIRTLPEPERTFHLGGGPCACGESAHRGGWRRLPASG